MLRMVLLSVALVGAGCISRRGQQLSLAHQISVPREWSSGRATPGPAGDSDVQRYIAAYEIGRSQVIHEYAKNIDYDPPSDLWTSSGWPTATYGWERGTGDAVLRIEQLTDAFGKRKLSEYLSQFKDSPWYEPQD